MSFHNKTLCALQEEIAFVLLLVLADPVFVGSVDQDLIITLFLEQTHLVGFVPWLTTEVYEAPLLKEGMHPDDRVDVASEVSPASGGAQVNLGVHAIEGNHKVAVLLVHGWCL